MDLVSVTAYSPTDLDTVATQLAAMSPWSVLGYSVTTLTAYLQTTQPGKYSFDIRSAGERIGILVVREPWLRGVYIELFAVFPTACQQGIGSQVIARLEEIYRSKSANLWALVSDFNTNAQHFYRRNGFVETGVLEDFVCAGHNEILIRKRLRY